MLSAPCTDQFLPLNIDLCGAVGSTLLKQAEAINLRDQYSPRELPNSRLATL
jgi:hypothetical protein